MNSYLYTATDDAGGQIRDSVEAPNGADALTKLVASGLSNVKFVRNNAKVNEDPDGLSRSGLEQIATFERLINTRPKFSTWLTGMLHSYRVVIGIGMLIVLWGLWSASALWVLGGVIVAFFLPARALWLYRGVSRYETLLRAYAHGDRKAVMTSADWLIRNVSDETVVLDAAMRKASVLARQDGMFDALESIEEWSLMPKDQRPANFDSRIASVYYFGGDYAQYLKSTQEAYFKDSENAVTTMDLAIAEAREGDVDKAAVLMKGIVVKDLPPYGLPFVDWTNGLIKQRRKDPQAQQDFAKAVSGLFNYGEHPIIWTTIAVCVGDYAMSATGDVAIRSAEQLLKPVWPMLRFHGNRDIVSTLADRYPSLESQLNGKT